MKAPFLTGILFGICLMLIGQTFAQQGGSEFCFRKASSKSVCYASFVNENTRIPASAEYLKNKNSQARTNTSTFEVEYVNFPLEAQEAFQTAVDIWQATIESAVTIRIKANWEPLGTGVLGSASPGGYVRNFDGVQKRNLWYPVALGEKMVGHDLNNTSSPDIEATFNSNYNSWYFGTDGATPTGRFDFVTIVLHEIGHGLGITHGYAVAGSTGTISSFFNNNPVVYESFLENSQSARLVTNFNAPSTELGTELTSNNLFFNGPNVLSQNLNLPAKIYAPATYSSGSSIAHVDEAKYPAGDPNSLMSPQIGFAESIHDPGPIAKGILKDIGWSGTYIYHEKLKNTEDVVSSFDVLANIVTEASYDETSVNLFYRISSGQFTSTSMTATGITNQFMGTLPSTGVASNYEYYISIIDQFGQEITNAGKIFTQGQPIVQGYFEFETGPDTENPVITHQPKPFVLAGDTELVVEANVSDNIEIQDVVVEYFVNDVLQGQEIMILTNAEDSVYSITLSYSAALTLNDKVKYRIIATDNSAAKNKANFPQVNFIELNAEGLVATQESYVNDFDGVNPDLDFFGDALFNIATVPGFTNAAIHTNHPYPNGIGSELESEFVFQLRVPIRLKTGQASLKFDEVVLVEPGDGSPFGSSGFFDYVVTEGSKDGGATWLPFADGYDSQNKPEWLTSFESSYDTESPPNSNADGNSTLFKTRIIDMLASGKFEAGDEVVIRFRLFADAFVHGWGWAIDNLKIQIDETPPDILHNQVDYILSTTDPLQIEFIASDINGVKSIAIDYQKNDEPILTTNLVVTPFVDLYTASIDLSGFVPGDELRYTIKATDENENEAVFPISGNFAAPIIDLNDTVENYSNNFNSPSNDFAGNFYLVSIPLRFKNPNLHSLNNYPVGSGLDNSSVLRALLKKSIIVNAMNPVITFDEIALLDPNDYMVVQASKDEGKTWIDLTDKYNSQNQSGWTGPWLNNRNADSTLFRKRTINIIESGNVAPDDKILIQFSLFTNEAVTGWGWAMDNLNIQALVTATEAPMDQVSTVKLFPNPTSDYLNLQVDNPRLEPISITLFDPAGRISYQGHLESNKKIVNDQIAVSNWPSGLYFTKTIVGSSVQYEKVIIRH